MTDAEQADTDDFFEQYEDLAVAVISDERPNDNIGISLCNAEMAEAVCEILDIDGFDLFENFDFATAYEKAPTKHMLGYTFLAYLRWQLWIAACHNQVGDMEFNTTACVHAELWYLRLNDRYKAMAQGEYTQHKWLN